MSETADDCDRCRALRYQNANLRAINANLTAHLTAEREMVAAVRAALAPVKRCGAPRLTSMAPYRGCYGAVL